jgi:hypothetical protein
MVFTILAGQVSGADHSTEISSTGLGNQQVIQTDHLYSFRVNNRAALYKSRQGASFAEGDELTASGFDRNGTFLIIACRNETSGAVYLAPARSFRNWGIIAILVGIPLIYIVIGFAVILGGLYWLFIGRRMSKANKLLESTPRRIKA